MGLCREVLATYASLTQKGLNRCRCDQWQRAWNDCRDRHFTLVAGMEVANNVILRGQTQIPGLKHAIIFKCGGRSLGG